MCFSLREQAYQYVAKGRRLHIQGRIAYGEVCQIWVKERIRSYGLLHIFTYTDNGLG